VRVKRLAATVCDSVCIGLCMRVCPRDKTKTTETKISKPGIEIVHQSSREFILGQNVKGLKCKRVIDRRYAFCRLDKSYLLMLVTSSTSSEVMTESNLKAMVERTEALRLYSDERFDDDLADRELCSSSSSLSWSSCLAR